ncbi:MAG: DUF2341 domain-containing protein [Clostridiales bacterium]
MNKKLTRKVIYILIICFFITQLNIINVFAKNSITIKKAELSNDNSYIDLKFSDGIYSNNGGSGAVELADFNLEFNQNGGVAELNMTDITDDKNNTLSGGEKNIRLKLSVTGASNGKEAFTISPIDSKSIFDKHGNSMSVESNTGTLNLNKSDDDDDKDDSIYSKKISINTKNEGVYISEDVNEFPLLIRLNSENFNFSMANNDGSDIRFKDIDGNELYYEIEKWDYNGKKATIWVLIPTILADNDEQYFNMYWGNGDYKSESDGKNLFKSENNFVGVWHLNEEGNSLDGGYKDSSINEYDIQGENMSENADTPSIIGNGQKLYGNSDYIKGVDSENLRLSDDMTISFWMNTSELSKDWVRLVGKGNSKGRNYGIWLNRSNKKILFQQYNQKGSAILNLTSSTSTELNSWHQITVKVENNKAYIYIDGIESGSKTRNGKPAATKDVVTFGYAGFHTYYKGILDEVKISDKARSDEWIKLEYENQKENQNLVELEIVPHIVSTSLTKNNSFIDVEVNQGIYTNNDSTGALNPEDFNIIFEKNGGVSEGVKISSITKTDGNSLSGGESNFRLNLDIDGFPSGVETIEIKPNELSIFNSDGKEMNTIETTGELNLNIMIEDIIVDNEDDLFETNGSKWKLSNIVKGFYGKNYIHDGTSTMDKDVWGKWTPKLKKEGRYKVYMRWTASSNRPDAAPVEIGFNGGKDTVYVNQKLDNSTWKELGTYNFDKDGDSYVKINSTDSGYTIADAVKFEYIGSSYNKWLYREQLYLDTTASGASISGDVSNFPVLIRLNEENFNFYQAKNDGEDIRFSDADGNELSYEIENWNLSSKEASIWVLIPKIFGDNKLQKINMYWGNSESNSQSDGKKVFNEKNNYEGVWHLSEEGSSDKDAYKESVAGFNGTGIDLDENSDVSSIIGKGQTLSGSNDYIAVNESDSYKISKDLTISFWMKTTAAARDWVRLVGKGNSKKRNYGIWLNRSNNKILFQQYKSSGSAALNLYSVKSTVNGEWTYVTATISGNAAKIFLNGESDSNGKRSATPATSSDDLTFGYAGFHTYYNGSLDEIRISDMARTDDWIKLEYENQKEDQTFVVIPKKPIITGGILAPDNSYVEVIINGGVYTDNNLTMPLTKEDFSLYFNKSEGKELNVTILDAVKTNGLPLEGGESLIRLNLNIDQTPEGVETIEVKSKGSNNIYNEFGLAMDWGQTTGPLVLNKIKSSTIIIDNKDSEFESSGKWTSSTVVKNYYGLDYVHDSTSSKDNSSIWAKWTPNITISGDYEIYMRWTAGGNRPDEAPLEVSYKEGLDSSRFVNQQKNGGIWNYIGKYKLEEGDKNYIKLLTSDKGYTIADAVKLVYVGSNYDDWLYNSRVYLDTSSTGANISDNVSEFPVLIDLDSSNFDFKRSNKDGSDLRFSDSYGKPLSYELENWDYDNKKAKVWVLVTNIYGNDSNQFIRMYWGNEAVKSESNGDNVFKESNDYQGVWHLDEEGNTTLESYKDSTQNENNMTGVSMNSSSDVEGVILKGQEFDGSKDYINGANGDSLKISGDLTVSFWMNTNAKSSDWVRLVGKGNSKKRNYGIWLNRSNRKILFQQYGSRPVLNLYSKTATTYGNWHFMTVTINGNSAKIYMDGKLDSSTNRSGTPLTSDDDLTFAYAGFHGKYNGILDEVRVSNMGKSADWIKLEYENQKENQTLVKVESNPIIEDYDLVYDNTYVDLTFNQGVYSTSNGKDKVSVEDFDITTESNDGNDIKININSLTDKNGNQLNGGETQIRFNLDLKGLISGVETFEIKPKDSSSIFNKAGVGMDSKQSTGDIKLNVTVEDPNLYDEWLYNTKIIIDTTKTGANLSTDIENVPVMVELNNSNFDFSLSKDNGEDIRFANYNGSKLDYEIEKWDKNGDKSSAYIWVLVPKIKSNDKEQFIKLYWGNIKAESKSDGNNVFDSVNKYGSVWHLGEEVKGVGNKNTYIDSVGNNNLTDNIDNILQDGIIGDGKVFDGNDYLEGTNSMFDFKNDDQFTISSWVKPGNNKLNTILSKIDKSSNKPGWDIFYEGVFGGELVNSKKNSLIKSTSEDFSSNTWNHVVFTYDGSKNALSGYDIYVNGLMQKYKIKTNALSNSISNENKFIIGGKDLGSYFNGSLDEIQISNTVRSEDFIKFSYENQKENQSVISVLPAVTFVKSILPDKSYKIGDNIDLEVGFSGEINFHKGVKLPYFIIEAGENESKAYYIENIDSKSLKFRFTVQEGDSTNDLDYEAGSEIVLNDSEIKNDKGFTSILLLPDERISLATNSDIKVDGVVPVINSVSINNGIDKIIGNELNIKINAIDIGTSVKEMLITENINNNEGWQEFKSETLYKLKDRNVSNIFIKVKDEAGNISEVNTNTINVLSKYFEVQIHEVRTKDNNIFEVGGIVPVKLKFKAEFDVSQLNVDLNLNLRKDEKTSLGLFLEPYLNGNEFDKDKVVVKVKKGASEVVELRSNNISINTRSNFIKNKNIFNITLKYDFEVGDEVEIWYLTKLTADKNVLKKGIYKYLESNSLINKELFVDFQISKWKYENDFVNEIYNKNTDNIEEDEIKSFNSYIKVENPKIIR